MGVAKEKKVMKEMNIVTDKEKKIYFRYAIQLEDLENEDEIENLFSNGIHVKRASLSGKAEELGVLENLKKYRPELLQAYLGGREFDPIQMGVEADLKKLFAEYGLGKGADVTCILELPRECKYANYIRSLQPIFAVEANDQIVIPSQFIKAVITKKEEGYDLWKGPNFDPKFELKKGIVEEKELNRIIHNFNPVATKETTLKESLEFVKKEFIATGDIQVYQKRLENFKKIYDARKREEEAVPEKQEAPRLQTLVPYEEKKNIFATFFQKLKKLFFGNSLAGNKEW